MMMQRERQVLWREIGGGGLKLDRLDR